MKHTKGPTRHNAFEEQPNTTNGMYGFDVMRDLRLKQAREAGRGLACCKREPMPQRVPCRRRILANYVGMNPQLEFHIAPKIATTHDGPYTPKPNLRDIYVGKRCYDVKPRLVQCKQRSLTGTITELNNRQEFFVAPHLKSTLQAPWVMRCNCN